MFDMSRLRGRIIEKYGTIGRFAEHTSRKFQFISNVLNGKSLLNQEDMDEWITLLDISDSDIAVYFFARKVHK